MGIKSLLNIRNATVSKRHETSDGMGGLVVTASTVAIPLCAIWQSGQSNPLLSDRVAKLSTHVLAIEPNAFPFLITDATVTANGRVYTIIGEPDDVAARGVLALIPLRVIS